MFLNSFFKQLRLFKLISKYKSMNNPFEKYYAKPNESGDYVVSAVFRPEMIFYGTPFSLHALCRGRDFVIYNFNDIIESKNRGCDTQNFKGLIGERILSVALEDLVGSAIDELAESPECAEITELSGGVLRENGKHEGKGFIVTYNDDFLIKYQGGINFIVLKKTHPKTPGRWYTQEKHGLKPSEIDGLGWLQVNSSKYLLIGEAKMIKSWKIQTNSPIYSHLKEKICVPFKSLFSSHELIYVFFGQEKLLYAGNQLLRSEAKKIASVLDSEGVRTIMLPFPKMSRTLDQYAETMRANALVVQEIVKKIGLVSDCTDLLPDKSGLTKKLESDVLRYFEMKCQKSL